MPPTDKLPPCPVCGKTEEHSAGCRNDPRQRPAATDYSLALSEFYRARWRRIRAWTGSWAGRPIDPISRAVMRTNAERYAQARGWQVVLTPARPRSTTKGA